MERKGVKILAEDGDLPEPGSTVIIRSHGISEARMRELEQTGARILDATCPFVGKIHSHCPGTDRARAQNCYCRKSGAPRKCGGLSAGVRRERL